MAPLPEVSDSRTVSPKKKTPTTPAPTSTSPSSIDSDHSDVQVSDLDSDLELDELVPTYLKVKSKLYRIDPELVDAKQRKQPKNNKGKKTTPRTMNQSPAVRKLLSQLQLLESDALFDEREAESLWPAMRNQIAQKNAAERQRREVHPEDDQLSDKDAVSEDVAPAVQEPIPSTDITDPLAGEDDTDLLGDMFSAIPDEPTSSKAVEEDAGSNVLLRDFGKHSGMSPRRVLEEAVRSRYAAHKTVNSISSWSNSKQGSGCAIDIPHDFTHSILMPTLIDYSMVQSSRN